MCCIFDRSSYSHRHISIRQKKDGILEMGVKKNRGGKVGVKLTYRWDVDTGTFQYIPYEESITRKVKKEDEVKSKHSDKSDVF